MDPKRGVSLDRRAALKTTGGILCGTAALSQVEAAGADDSTASVTIGDQESDGGSISIASLRTDVDARLYITLRGEEDTPPFKRLDLSAGTSFTDRTVYLDRLIDDSTTVWAVILAGEEFDNLAATTSALVAVGESLEAAQSTQNSSNDEFTTGYDTPPQIQRIDEDPDAGFHSPYFLYTPSTPGSGAASVSDSRKRPLLVEVFTWDDHQTRVDNARKAVQYGTMRTVGDRTNCPVLVAPLPFGVLVDSRFGVRSDVEFTDPRRKRVDLQLRAMIDDAISRLNGGTYTVVDRIHFDGTSSTGVFIDTFAALHPEYVRAFSSGANGIAFLPFARLTDDIPTYGDPEQDTVPWPIGTGRFEEFVGEEFDKQEWMDIDQYRWIGENDQDPENPDEYIHKAYRDSGRLNQLIQDIFGSLQVDHRFETSRKIYDSLGVPATFTIFEGAGHIPGDTGLRKIADYHEQTVVEDFEVVHLLPRKSATQVGVGDSVTVTVTAENPTSLEATTSVVFAVDGTTVDTADPVISPNSTSELTFSRTFDEPGTYSLTVNGQQIGGDPVTVTESASSGTTGPGFGLGAALTGVAGLGYLLGTRTSEE